MFEEIRFDGTPREDLSIVVETRSGRRLENTVLPGIGQQQVNFYRALRRKYGARWKNRKPAMGQYNCAGMAWASRRTALTSPVDWEAILADDGYRQLVAFAENPLAGDIVIYKSAATREILHVARIVNCPTDREDALQIWALSKWSGWHGEDFHPVGDVCPFGGEDFSMEFWTDRGADFEAPAMILPS